MKTITQIQAQITSLASQLSQLAGELNAVKTQGAAGHELAAKDELAAIEARAAREPICNKRLKNADDGIRRTCMRFLSAVAGGNAEALTAARRLGLGSGSAWTAERLAAESAKIDGKFAADIASMPKELALPLLMDSLMVTYALGEANDRAVSLIAEAADLMNADEKDVKVVTSLASALATRNQDRYDNIYCDCFYEGFAHWIPADWLKDVHIGEVFSYLNFGGVLSCSTGVKFLKVYSGNFVHNKEDLTCEAAGKEREGLYSNKHLKSRIAGCIKMKLRDGGEGYKLSIQRPFK
jgi:hypothetical protein